MTEHPVSPEEFRIEIVTVTPDMAHRWLLTNHELNRNVRDVRVRLFAKEMAKNNWHLTGEPIQFSKTGVLLNGQHRLRACILADVPFTTAVAYGVEDSTMHVIDTGTPRTFGDLFKLESIANASRISSICRRLVGWDQNLWNNRDLALVTRDELAEFALKNDEALQEAGRRGDRIYRKQKLSVTSWSVFVYRAAQVDDDFAALFTEKMSDPTLIEANEDALKALDTWCRGAVPRKLRPTEQLVASAYGWNSWVTGHQRKLIKINPNQVVPPPLEGAS